MGLFLDYKFSLSTTYQKDPIVSTYAVRLDLLKNLSYRLSNNIIGGIGNNEITNARVIVANASTGGASYSLYQYTNQFNDVVSIRYVRLIALFNNSSTVGQNILMGGSFSETPWLSGTNPKDVIPPGGCVFRTANVGTVFTISQSVSAIIEIYSAAGTPEFELYIAGM